jgi:hypothetical protein
MVANAAKEKSLSITALYATLPAVAQVDQLMERRF